MDVLHARCPCVPSTSRPADQGRGSRRRRGSGQCKATVAPPAPAPDSVSSSNGHSNGVPHLNAYSRTVTQPKQQGGSQAMLYAAGLKEGDMDKAQVRCCSGVHGHLHAHHRWTLCQACCWHVPRAHHCLPTPVKAAPRHKCHALAASAGA